MSFWVHLFSPKREDGFAVHCTDCSVLKAEVQLGTALARGMDAGGTVKGYGLLWSIGKGPYGLAVIFLLLFLIKGNKK